MPHRHAQRPDDAQRLAAELVDDQHGERNHDDLDEADPDAVRVGILAAEPRILQHRLCVKVDGVLHAAQPQQQRHLIAFAVVCSCRIVVTRTTPVYC